MATIGKTLPVIDSRNPKDIIIAGLNFKIEELGLLRVPFDISTDYPSRETFEKDQRDTIPIKRRIVVKKLNNTVQMYGIGNTVDGEINLADVGTTTPIHESLNLGWVDQYTMELSVWSTDSKDRDNIVELIKLWMLELEQDVYDGTLEFPFYYLRELFAIRFIRAYEGTNHDLYIDGPVYIGTLVYSVMAPFFNDTSGETYQQYKVSLTETLVDNIQI